MPNTDGVTDHEFNFNPRISVPDVESFNQRATVLSEVARQRHRMAADLRYGEGALATLDVFPAGVVDAPLHVFLHGGYWRGRDKADYSYIADTLVPQGITTVVMNYDLCPAVSLPDIVKQVRSGLRWICEHASELGGRADQITLSGHSAGAHLIALALAHDSDDPLPEGAIKAAVLISGIYELTPVLNVSVNSQIRLLPDQVEAMSPMRHLPRHGVTLAIVVGGGESAGWIAQSAEFAAACGAAGLKASYSVFGNHHHYSIMTMAEQFDNELSRLIVEFARAS